ncbi:Avo1p [Sporobolomyces koalae]|uniref:Avo1p n=1 Tax=Sporobolomyces koalae TaxID=500713 RepID=UPI00317D4BCE
MSLLTDTDFLLRAFQLSYIRQVLPNHAPDSSRAGQGPYNPVSFANDSDRVRSAYLVQSGLADQQQWPELASGRTSPPLALTLARDSSRSSHHGRRSDSGDATSSGNRTRRAGPGHLGYTQTIVGKGSIAGGAGMRVDGIKRSWKGKGKLLEPGGADLDPQVLLSPSCCLAPNLVPPPVVVHSPVRTPRDSPHANYRHHPASDTHLPPIIGALDARTLPQDPNATLTAIRRPRFSTSANEYHSYPDYQQSQDPTSPHMPAIDSPAVSLADEYPSQPNSQVTDSSSAFQLGASTPASPLSLPEPNSTSPSPSTDDRPRGTEASSSLVDPDPVPQTLASSDFPDGPLQRQDSRTVAGPLSMASSGISLFGTSRLERSTELARGSRISGEDSSDQSEVERRKRTLAGGASRIRTDSDLSLASNAPELAPVIQAPAPPPPNVPVFQLPPGIKIRERRRVNIKPGVGGALFVPNTVPMPAPATPSQGTIAPPKPAQTNTAEREVLNSAVSPIDPTEQIASVKRPPLTPSRTRKVSGPAPLTAGTEFDKLVPPSPGSRSPRRRDEPSSPVLSFPKRSSYVQLHSATTLSAPNRNPSKSALTALLTSPSSSSLSQSNPFSTLYAACISRSSSKTEQVALTLYFPHSTKPGPTKPAQVRVKRDVTVEEVIGVGLWTYWDEQEKGEREPKLEVDEEQAESGVETTKWNLRIVEDDGEVDEDFPAIDRLRTISAFSFTEFAIVRATDQQVQDNVSKQATITRRPSRILSGPKRVASGPVPVAATLAPQAATHTNSATVRAPGDSFRPQSKPDALGASSALAIPVSLSIQLPPTSVASNRSTQVEVPSDMYLADVLELICNKCSLGSSSDWALIVRLSDGDIVVPIDRTVESLGDQHELHLVARNQIGTVGNLLRQRRNPPKNIDPSASIFEQQAEEPATPRYQSTSQMTSTYQLYRVQRKLPMSLGGRHPRLIAIDGDYLHFMPTDGRDSTGRTSSFHISLVQSCKVSRRSASTFKIVVHTKNRVDKRYDFEADNPTVASEIVEAVRIVAESWRAEQRVLANRRGVSRP